MTTPAPTSTATGFSVKSTFQEVVNISVGAEKTRYAVHKDLLIHHSGFFRAALTGGWREAQENAVDLPEDDPSVFHAFIQFLYSGKVHGEQLCNSQIWCERHIFAAKIQAIRFANYAIDMLALRWDKMTNLPCRKACNSIYENTDESSPLRSLLIDLYAYEGRKYVLDEVMNNDDDEDFENESEDEASDDYKYSEHFEDCNQDEDCDLVEIDPNFALDMARRLMRLRVRRPHRRGFLMRPNMMAFYLVDGTNDKEPGDKVSANEESADLV